MHIKDKVVFITGGASGIGLATAKKLLSEDAKVVVYSRNAREIDDEFDKKNSLLIEGDVCDRSKTKKAVEAAIKKFGALDILINNAGVAQRKDFMDTTEKDWDFIFDVNIKGMFTVTQEALRVMDSKDKIIVNIASGAGIYGIGGLPIYSASKAAVINFTQSLSQELKERKIKVFCIAPGSTDTKMFSSLFPETKARHTPEQVAEVIYEAIIGEIKPDENLIVDVFYHAR